MINNLDVGSLFVRTLHEIVKSLYNHQSTSREECFLFAVVLASVLLKTHVHLREAFTATFNEENRLNEADRFMVKKIKEAMEHSPEDWLIDSGDWGSDYKVVASKLLDKFVDELVR